MPTCFICFDWIHCGTLMLLRCGSIVTIIVHATTPSGYIGNTLHTLGLYCEHLSSRKGVPIERIQFKSTYLQATFKMITSELGDIYCRATPHLLQSPLPLDSDVGANIERPSLSDEQLQAHFMLPNSCLSTADMMISAALHQQESHSPKTPYFKRQHIEDICESIPIETLISTTCPPRIR